MYHEKALDTVNSHTTKGDVPYWMKDSIEIKQLKQILEIWKILGSDMNFQKFVSLSEGNHSYTKPRVQIWFKNENL